MHVEPKMIDEADTLAQAGSGIANEGELACPQPVHNIMDVLFPAKPPEPKNARVIRLFDLEAAKNDPAPAVVAAAVVGPAVAVGNKPEKKESRSREALRAQRNQSLRVAAGLV